MDAKLFLNQYVDSVNSYFDNFFSRETKEASKVDKLAKESLITLKEYISGGKKVRGALTVLGYQSQGGTAMKDIIPISAAVEIMHSCLLIHDDFVDNDDYRRGKPTIHNLYAQKISRHYGDSMAVMIGDIGIFLCNRIFAESNFEDKRKVNAISEFQKFLINTGYGELMDIAFDYKEDLTWNDILKIRLYKTAYYTFVMPLSVGAILADSDKNKLKAIERYGEPVGIAFQLRDDILGIFGDSEKTGKSNTSDIREGKKTLILAKALELSNKDNSRYLKRWYGAKDIKVPQIEKIKTIIKESGACEYLEDFSGKLVKKGKKSVSSITDDRNYQEIYNTLSDYVISRER